MLSWNGEIMNTDYGKFHINKQGYYVKNVYLHNLVWVNFYGKPVPKGYVIHHINEDKTDNRIQNLQCVKSSTHTRFHMKGKKLSEDTKNKMSETKKGYNHSIETRQKLSKYKKGRKWTPNQRRAYEKRFMNIATINKRGIRNNKTRYTLRYNGESLKHSTNREMLEMIADEMNHC